MPRKLILAAKKLKQKVKKTPENCKKFWNLCNKQRGILVCSSIHRIFVAITTAGALPYRVEKLENGYRNFVHVQGLKKWYVKGMYAFMVLRTVPMALLPLSSKLRLAVGGNLTADCLSWVLNLQVAAVPAILCYKFGRNSKDVELIYNALGQVMRSATRKYFKGKHIFELARIPWAVVLVLVYMSGVATLVPILSLGVFIPTIDSPNFFCYHVAGPYSEIQSDETLRIALYWIAAMAQEFYLVYVAWILITLMILMGEGFIGCTILLKNIRNLSPEEISWREKNKIHAQLEIVLAMYNNWVGFASPLTTLAGLMFSVCSILSLMKMDLEVGFPNPSLIPIFIMFGAGGSLGGAAILKYAEELRANSIALLKETEDTITAWALLEVRQKSRVSYYPTGRSFRRRPTGVRLGSFGYLEEGVSTSYLMQIQDNVINYFFMLDFKSHPLWLK